MVTMSTSAAIVTSHRSEKEMKTYQCTQSGRSILSVSSTVLVGLLAIGFALSDSLFLLAPILGFFALSGIYSFVKNEKWKIEVIGRILSWHYPRWPQSTGSINLDEVKHIIVNDCSSCLSITTNTNQEQKIKFCGCGADFQNYLNENFPSISTEYIAGT